MALITNANGKMLGFNCWRSVDIKDGKLELIRFDDKSQYVQFDAPAFSNLQIGYIKISLEVCLEQVVLKKSQGPPCAQTQNRNIRKCSDLEGFTTNVSR